MASKGVVPSDWTGADGIRFLLDMASSTTTAYWDAAYAYAHRIKRYTVPTTILEGPYQVLIQGDMDQDVAARDNFRQMGINETPPQGRILRVIGKGKLSTMTADTSTVEIGEPQTQILIAQALRYMYRALQGSEMRDSSDVPFYQVQESRWRDEVAHLIRNPAVRQHGLTAEYPRAWGVEDDSAGRYLFLGD